MGTLGYMRIERWSAFDALYMTVSTLSTVGLEVRPLSTAGRGAHYIASGTLTSLFRSQRMQRSIDALREHYIVCGYGRVGRHVAEDLANHGVRVVVVERDATVLGDANGATPPPLARTPRICSSIRHYRRWAPTRA